MEISTLLAQQFTDIFRLGLLVGLIYTTERTRSQTGVLLPLAAGVIFVAVIIPSTMPRTDVPLWLAVATGVVVNAVVVAVFWTAWQAYSRSRRV
jgi:hypothetical protein